MAGWRDQLLKGVDEIPKYGIPGTVVVFGENAQGIMTGTGAADVMMAAAKYENGRVIVFPQGSYSEQFYKWAKQEEDFDVDVKQLCENIAQWFIKDDCFTFDLKDRIVDVSDLDEIKEETLSNAFVVVWTSSDPKSKEFVDAIRSFIAAGGNLIGGSAPWGYLQLNPAKTLKDMVFNRFIHEMGLAYTPHYVNSGHAFETAKNKAHACHLRHALAACDLTPGGTVHNFDIFTKSLQYVPKDELNWFIDAIEQIYAANKEKVHHVPTREKPVKTPEGKVMLSLCELIHRYGNPTELTIPGLELFPGIFETEPTLTDIIVEINAPRLDYYATGFYAPPGKQIEVEVLSTMKPNKEWTMMIGCHVDDNYNCGKFKRWPVVTQKFEVQATKFTASNIFGGGIYFVSPLSSNIQKLKVKLTNVVECPYIDATDKTSVENWPQRREAPGLWADLSGEFVTFTLPAACVRGLKNPEVVLQLWDRVITSHHSLKGSNIRQRRRQWIVFDAQPKLGYMHAGYPIVACLDHDLTAQCHEIEEFVLDYDYISTKGRWGVFHEMGHNMQDSAWTFDGTLEVTVNIFTLHAMEVICGVKPWIHPWIQSHMKEIQEFLNGSCDFKSWKKLPGVALGIYAQIIHHFGWGAFKTVFREYEAMKNIQKPTKDQDKIDEWVTRLSKVCKVNLVPLHDFWGIPMSSSVHEELKNLPGFFPADEIMDMAPGRCEEICDKYTDLVAVAEKVADDFEYTVDPARIQQPYTTVTVALAK